MTHIGPHGKDAARPLQSLRKATTGPDASSGKSGRGPVAQQPVRSQRSCNLVIYLSDLSGGGAERLHVRLASKFIEAGHRVTFLLDRRAGELLSQLPAGCQVHTLGA